MVTSSTPSSVGSDSPQAASLLRDRRGRQPCRRRRLLILARSNTESDVDHDVEPNPPPPPLERPPRSFPRSLERLSILSRDMSLDWSWSASFPSSRIHHLTLVTNDILYLTRYPMTRPRACQSFLFSLLLLSLPLPPLLRGPSWSGPGTPVATTHTHHQHRICTASWFLPLLRCMTPAPQLTTSLFPCSSLQYISNLFFYSM